MLGSSLNHVLEFIIPWLSFAAFPLGSDAKIQYVYKLVYVKKLEKARMIKTDREEFIKVPWHDTESIDLLNLAKHEVRLSISYTESSSDEVYKSMKKQELQAVLKSKNKKVSGLHPELVERCIEFSESPVLPDRHLELLDLSVFELKLLCNEHNLKRSGTIPMMALRVFEYEVDLNDEDLADDENVILSENNIVLNDDEIDDQMIQD